MVLKTAFAKPIYLVGEDTDRGPDLLIPPIFVKLVVSYSDTFKN